MNDVTGSQESSSTAKVYNVRELQRVISCDIHTLNTRLKKVESFLFYVKIATLATGLVYSGYKLFQLYSKRKSDNMFNFLYSRRVPDR